jgi:Glycosyltransferase
MRLVRFLRDRVLSGARSVAVSIADAWLDRAVERAQPRARDRTRVVEATAGATRPPVRFLLLDAWGVGGTTRTTFTTAAHLGSNHDVEVVSVLRTARAPGIALPPGLRLRALFDQTTRRPTPRNLAALLLGRAPSRLWHENDYAYKRASLWTDVLLVRWLRSLPAGTVAFATRPAAILLMSALAPAGVFVIAQEHQKLSRQPLVMQKALASALHNVSVMVALTEVDRADYEALVGAGGPPVLAIPNAVPDVPLGPGDPGSRRLIAAGRLVNQKGFDLLLQAFATVAARHPDWTLQIYGHGALRDQLEQSITDLGVGGQANLNPPTDRLGERMREASVYVLSSRFEGFPLVLLEAMSAGLVVVSFDCPTGPNEIVTDGVNGLLVPALDVKALALALDRVMSDESLRRRLAAAAPPSILRYSSQVVGQRWDDLLGHVPAA